MGLPAIPPHTVHHSHGSRLRRRHRRLAGLHSLPLQFQGSEAHGPSARIPRHRTGRHRPRAVLRHDALRHGSGGDPRRSRWRFGAARARCLGAQPALHRRGLEAARRRGGRPQAGGNRRCAVRGFPARRYRTARHWPGRLPSAQREACVRAHDWLGAGRPHRPRRRSRHQLHRPRRRSARHRRAWRQAGAAPQSHRRLRRRRHAASLWARVRHAGGIAFRQGPSDRRGDGGRRGLR